MIIPSKYISRRTFVKKSILATGLLPALLSCGQSMKAADAKMVVGSGTQRLQQIKKKYDSNNIFHRNQNILPI